MLFIFTVILLESHDTFYSLTQDTSYVLLASSAHFGMTFAYFFILNPKETNRTKILRKLWCPKLQTGVEGVKGDKGIFTYPPAFFLPLVFENSCCQSFIEYSTVTFWFDPCSLLPTGYRKRAKILIGACSVIKNYEKRHLLRCIHHFKSDLINNMDHFGYWTLVSDP